jgi:TetR/AcrR family transcriptional repressor of nem operon
VLGAEIGSLPTSVGGNTKIFFNKNIEWLTTALTTAGFSDTKAKANALHIIASLEGAMIVSKSLGENAVFESVAKTLVRFVYR